MPIPAAGFRRFAACAAALVCVAVAATTAGAPTARAADGRELLANAIATTRGSYLVYNFGGGAPAPMLNAGGGCVRDEQRRPPDDHQVRVATNCAATDRRFAFRLSGPLRTRSSGAHRRRTVAGLRDLHAAAGMAGAWPADDRDQRQLLRRAGTEGRLVEVDGMQFSARRLRRQHPRAGPRQHRGDGHRRLRRQAGPVGRR